jgi:catechol 2,3-dioxygenase-like lactoylglutathione lyase family enzyme
METSAFLVSSSKENFVATIRYLVKDVDAALPFYAALGFELADRWGPPFAAIKRGDLSVWLSGPGTSAAKPLSDGSVPQPGGWNRLVIEVDDLDALLAALKAQGAQFRSEPIKGPGGRQVLVDDPSGNPIELFEARE